MRWIVLPGHGPTLRDVLARAGADPDAVDHGRVFIGRRRARSGDEPVRQGDVVEIAPASPPADAARILWHAGDLVAVDKAAGVPTIADHAGARHALLTLTADALGIPSSRLHPTSRLDRDVSGVVIFALSVAEARRLAAARQEGRYVRRYVAIAARSPVPERGEWRWPIGRASDPRRRRIGGVEPVDALTRYAVGGSSPAGFAMLALGPVTGRTHQLRLHASHAGAPLVGDRLYGGAARVTLPGGQVLEPRRVALHAARVVVPDSRGMPVPIVAPIPIALTDLWAALGGEPAAWQLCASCDLESF